MRRIFELVVIFLTIFMAATSAKATITQFSDRASFISSSSDLTNLTFDGPPNNSIPYPDGLTEEGVSFRIEGNGYLYEIGPGYGPAWYDWGSGGVLSAQNSYEPNDDGDIVVGEPGVTLNATLPSGIRAVGSDFMSFAPYGSTFQITLATGGVFTFEFQSLDYPNRAFAGFVSDVDISSIHFQNEDGQFLNIDNFAFGNARLPVPEPSAFLLLGLGLAGLGAYRIRSRA